MTPAASGNHSQHHTDRALHAVLEALFSDPLLSRDYVLKGGLALRLVYGSPRRSEDVDLSAARPFTDEVTEEKNDMLMAFCEVLNDAMRGIEARHGLRDMRVGERTLSVDIPALLGSVHYRTAESPEEHEVKMQVTLSELICETHRQTYHGVSLHVAALEDILADKLKAMLQQVTRNKLRPMDVYDVWYYTLISPQRLDLARLRQYLEIKAARWPEVFPPTRERFHSRALREYSSEGFRHLTDRLEADAPRVTFEDAFSGVLTLVDRLELPELARSGEGRDQ